MQTINLKQYYPFCKEDIFVEVSDEIVLPPMQARRVHARYMLGMKVKDIAAMEGITPSQAENPYAALRRLRRYFARQKWTVDLEYFHQSMSISKEKRCLT